MEFDHKVSSQREIDPNEIVKLVNYLRYGSTSR